MSDDADKPKLTLPAFTPVPRQCERHDGWTPERQQLFIEALADYGSVRAAANSVGLAPEGAYRLRRLPGAEEFAAAWEAALAHGVRRIEDALMDRALNGVEVPVYSYGKLIGARTVYDNRLGMFMLRNRLPERFAAGGGPRALNAVGKMELTRLKKQWRAEWDAEREEEERAAAPGPDFIAQLELMHRRWYGSLSPHARAAYRVFRRLERDDHARGCPEMGHDAYQAAFPAEYRAALEAEYDQVFRDDRRAKASLWMEADSFGVDEALEGAPDDTALTPLPPPAKEEEPPE